MLCRLVQTRSERCILTPGSVDRDSLWRHYTITQCLGEFLLLMASMGVCVGGVGAGRAAELQALHSAALVCKAGVAAVRGRQGAGRRPHTHSHCCTHIAYSTMGQDTRLWLHTSVCLPSFFMFLFPLLQAFLSCFSFLSVSFTQYVFPSWLPLCCRNIQHPVPFFDLDPLFSLSSHPLLFCACLPSDLLALLVFPSLVRGSDDW